MQVWTSSEAMLDVNEPLNSARKDVERALNALVGCEDYGVGFSEWVLIYIVMDEDDPAYPEVRATRSALGSWSSGSRWTIKPSRKPTNARNGGSWRRQFCGPLTFPGS